MVGDFQICASKTASRLMVDGLVMWPLGWYMTVFGHRWPFPGSSICETFDWSPYKILTDAFESESNVVLV